jgi:hypothetical protein
MCWYLEEILVDQIYVGEMTVGETSLYNAAPVVLPGERGIREGESRKGKKEKELKIAFSLFFDG